MNLSYFISKRIIGQQQKGFSSSIYRIALVSIGLGLAASIVAFSIMFGFEEAIKARMYSFSGHMVINQQSLNNSLEETPLSLNNEIFTSAQKFDFVLHTQEYANKAGLIKTEDEILGVLVKGVSTRFDTLTFAGNLVAGRFLTFNDSVASQEVLISKNIASKLNIHVGEKITVHFFQTPPRLRRLTVVGIYQTHLSEYFDDKVILTDIQQVRKLNDWADTLAGGIEVFIKNPDRAEYAATELSNHIDYDQMVITTRDKFQNIFQWLDLLARQVRILLAIILVVICVNMISVILIMVMERTAMIGLLKALGSGDTLIRKVFLQLGVSLIGRGLVWGNVVGIGFCALQYYFKLIPLNPQNYYIAYVPISWHWEVIVMLNVLILVLVTLVLLIPTLVIAKVNPIKAIKFD
ncbi:MAG: ABC transporter permease [Cyclobacteriaceae bacterium]|nr:ABC transporter permease [Cyclobacteriaceae bacterium]